MSLRLVVCAVAALFPLTACAGDEAVAPSPSPARSGPPSPTATTSGTSTATPSTTASRSASPTPAPTLRAAADGDVDGDGRRDQVAVSDPGTGATEGTWRLMVRLTSGPTRTASVHGDASGAPEVFGVVDADADGRAEVFLKTGQGASAQIYTPFRLVGASLVEMTRGGSPAQLVVGGGVTHGDGFSCEDLVPGGARELVVRSVTSSDGAVYQGTVTAFALTGGELVAARRTSFNAPADDPRVRAAYDVRCGSLGG